MPTSHGHTQRAKAHEQQPDKPQNHNCCAKVAKPKQPKFSTAVLASTTAPQPRIARAIQVKGWAPNGLPTYVSWGGRRFGSEERTSAKVALRITAGGHSRKLSGNAGHASQQAEGRSPNGAPAQAGASFSRWSDKTLGPILGAIFGCPLKATRQPGPPGQATRPIQPIFVRRRRALPFQILSPPRFRLQMCSRNSPHFRISDADVQPKFSPPQNFGCKCAAEILPASKFRLQMCSRKFHRLRISAADVQPKFSKPPNFGCRCAAEIVPASKFRLHRCSRNSGTLEISAAHVQPKFSH